MEGQDAGLSKRRCSRCSRELRRGKSYYTVNIRVYSGFDGVLLEEGEIDQRLKRAVEESHQWTPEELEKDVYEEMTLLLCGTCRNEFVRELQNPWQGAFQTQKTPDGMIH